MHGEPGEEVPGELFTLDAPFDLLDVEVSQGSIVRVVLYNQTKGAIVVRSCLLGRSL